MVSPLHFPLSPRDKNYFAEFSLFRDVRSLYFLRATPSFHVARSHRFTLAVIGKFSLCRFLSAVPSAGRAARKRRDIYARLHIFGEITLTRYIWTSSGVCEFANISRGPRKLSNAHLKSEPSVCPHITYIIIDK